MTGNIFTDALFWFFAISGMFSILSDIAGFFYSLAKGKTNTEQCIVLTVKNNQDNIEALLRSIVWQNLHKNNGGSVPDIIVVDLGSDDDTQKILERICSDYNFVHVTDREGYIELIRKMS